MIKTSGFQVWPREIEEVISAHPAVHGGRRGRRARRGQGRGGQGVGRAEGRPDGHRGRAARLLPRAAGALQGAGGGRVPDRAAEDDGRQGAAAVLARGDAQRRKALASQRASARTDDAGRAQVRPQAAGQLRPPLACRRARRWCRPDSGTRLPSTASTACSRTIATARRSTTVRVVDDARRAATAGTSVAVGPVARDRRTPRDAVAQAGALAGRARAPSPDSPNRIERRDRPPRTARAIASASAASRAAML